MTMARHKFTADQVEFLRFAYPLRRVPEVTRIFNRIFGTALRESQIMAALKNRRIRSGRQSGYEQGERPLLLTDEQVAFLRTRYRQVGIKEVTAEINERFGTSFSCEQIKAFATRYKILSGRTGCFEKGIVPWNTGTKGVCKPNSGTFKKGNVPGNIRPLGSERICSKDGYVLAKVAERNPYTGHATRFKAKHIVIWERAHGPVPDGFVINFIDGDRLHCSLDNLELVSRNEHCRLNQLGGRQVATGPLRPVAKTIARIAMRRGELKKMSKRA